MIPLLYVVIGLLVLVVISQWRTSSRVSDLEGAVRELGAGVSVDERLHDRIDNVVCLLGGLRGAVAATAADVNEALARLPKSRSRKSAAPKEGAS